MYAQRVYSFPEGYNTIALTNDAVYMPATVRFCSGREDDVYVKYIKDDDEGSTISCLTSDDPLVYESELSKRNIEKVTYKCVKGGQAYIDATNIMEIRRALSYDQMPHAYKFRLTHIENRGWGSENPGNLHEEHEYYVVPFIETRSGFLTMHIQFIANLTDVYEHICNIPPDESLSSILEDEEEIRKNGFESALYDSESIGSMICLQLLSDIAHSDKMKENISIELDKCKKNPDPLRNTRKIIVDL